MKPICLIVLLAAVVSAQAQPNWPSRPSDADRNRPGPWDNDVLVFRVATGGKLEKLATFERAGVPTLGRMKDGRLIAAFQSFPQDDNSNFDRVAVRFSSDEGRAWTKPEPIVVQGMEAGLARPFDPTLVPLPGGRVRLYFTSNRGPEFRRSTPQIYSAISTNGIHYVFEPGVRFGIEGRIVIDCAVALHEGVFHLLVPDNATAGEFMARPQRGQQPIGGSGYHAISKDGLKFERVADVRPVSVRDRWLGNLLSDGGKLVFFGTGPGPWPVTSQDGVTWKPSAAATRVPGADPGAVKLRDASWLLLVTGEPRPGTPSALQRGNRRGPIPSDERGLGGNPRPPNKGGPMTPSPGAPDMQRGLSSPPPPSGGLRSHQVLSATSADGLSWTRDEGVRIASASVPCAINDGDRRVLLYFVKPPSEPRQPETLACAVSTDGMKFDPAPEFRIEDLSTLKAVDPSILRDGEGRFRLYYLASDHRGDPASGENPHKINFALSDDGLHFREAGTTFSHDNLVDPDVFRFKDRWFMYVFAGRGTVIATSVDGRNFQFLRDMTPRDWGTTAAVQLPDGRLRLYAFEQRVPIGNAVRSYLSTNGVDWTAEPGDRLKAGAGEQVTDPFVIPWRGGYKMFFKTSPARTPRVSVREDVPGPGDGGGNAPAIRRPSADAALSYPIVDTGQTKCYDNRREILLPKPSQPFYGQDAQFQSHPASYTLNADGLTVHDNVTSLTWQGSPDADGDGKLTRRDKLTFAQAQALPTKLNQTSFGGFNDWRLPTIKELYSLFDGRGTDPSGPMDSDTSRLKPYLDTQFFRFVYGDVTGERVIDSQYASSSKYVGKGARGFDKLFGVNFADGRIKGYDLFMPGGGTGKTFFVMCVRGNPAYGKNDFHDNGDVTITDRATGLMWAKSDSGHGMNWQDALAWAQQKNAERFLGHNDWRVPSVKELQSIVDYTRSPDTSQSPAIDPIFNCTTITNEAHQADWPFYWTSTTHSGFQGGASAMYVAFGRAAGWMSPRRMAGGPPGRRGGFGAEPGGQPGFPPGAPASPGQASRAQSGGQAPDYRYVDVHGAGAQRSDPKAGNPAQFPYGRGPQGDVVRIFNFVRLVRDAEAARPSRIH